MLDQNFSLTLAASMQHTIVKGPDHELAIYSRPAPPGFRRSKGFGGAYVVFDFSTLPGKPAITKTRWCRMR